MPLPVYTNDQIADYLTHGFWGGSSNPLTLTSGNTIYVDFNGFSGANPWGDSDSDGIPEADRVLARAALQVWADATGLNFVEGNGPGTTIQFYDSYGGAYGGNFGSLGIVNIHPSFSTRTGDYDAYIFQTFIHEIGHALGLGHAGDYDGSADYSETEGAGDNHYLNDSWQATVMSYFSQFENTWLDATTAYTITPMVADVIAIRNLYGTTGTTRTGNTTYGHNSNAGGVIGDWENYGNYTVMVVVDDGGTDTFDFSNGNVEQLIDLREEAFSNVLGETGTVGISRDTVIENAVGGSAKDTIHGNDANNVLLGKNGDDELRGYDGADTLRGGSGLDKLYGGKGQDSLYGGKGNDYIEGNDAADDIRGGGGKDEIYGGSGADTIKGNGGVDTIYGGSGNDTIYGGGNGDYINGGADDDTLYGEKGNDRLIGGAGNDEMHGGDGDDKLSGQSGDDIYYGDAGADVFIFDATHTGSDTVKDWGNGADTVEMRNGTPGDFILTAVSGDIQITSSTNPGLLIIIENGVANGFDAGDIVFV